MLRKLREYRESVKGEADEFMESFGDRAYAEARKEMSAARDRGDHKQEKFFVRVSLEIAKRTDIEIGLDTATRYLEPQTPYDAGLGLVVHRPKDSTLH
jgi:hypothetical protein